MSKTFTELYDADTAAADTLTGNEIVPFDPDPNTGPTTSKGMTLDQLLVWIAAELGVTIP